MNNKRIMQSHWSLAARAGKWAALLHLFLLLMSLFKSPILTTITAIFAFPALGVLRAFGVQIGGKDGTFILMIIALSFPCYWFIFWAAIEIISTEAGRRNAIRLDLGPSDSPTTFGADQGPDRGPSSGRGRDVGF